MSLSTSEVVVLWAYSPSQPHYGPQFVAAVAEGLQDAWTEEYRRVRELTETWFGEFGDVTDWQFFTTGLEVEKPAVPDPEPRECEYCSEGEHDHCDNCGHKTAARKCPQCGSWTCEIEAMEIGDARERQGLPR